MRIFEAKKSRVFGDLPKTKTLIVLVVAMCIMAIQFAGCIKVNVNKEDMSVDEILANKSLVADPAEYNNEGSYTFTFRYDKGGFEDMDLSQAYEAYFPFTVFDQIDAIVDGDTEETPPLPEDAQDAIDEVTGANQLEKIAVITIETVDDSTLKVSFTDNDNPLEGREYFFVIPNEGLSGSVIPD